MAKRKASPARPKATKTLDEPPVLSLSKCSAELLAELAKRERREGSEILNDALAAYAAANSRTNRKK